MTAHPTTAVAAATAMNPDDIEHLFIVCLVAQEPFATEGTA